MKLCYFTSATSATRHIGYKAHNTKTCRAVHKGAYKALNNTDTLHTKLDIKLYISLKNTLLPLHKGAPLSA